MTKLDPVKNTPFMSVVEGRRPRQKVHTSIAHAKNAFDTPKKNDLVKGPYGSHMTHGWGAIFEYIDGEWVEIYTITQPTEADKINDKSSYYAYETRPWRRHDRIYPDPRNEGVRAPSHQGAEPAGPGGHVGGVPGPGGGSLEGRDDQRAAGGRHAPQEHDLLAGVPGGNGQEATLTRAQVIEELTRTREQFEHHQALWAEKGFDRDRTLMVRFEGRMYGLMWVVERMS